MTPGTTAKMRVRPGWGRAVLMGLGVAVFSLGVLKGAYFWGVWVGVALMIRGMRVGMVMFDEGVDGPWWVRVTWSWLGLRLAWRSVRRREIEVVARYRGAESTTEPGHTDRYWREVRLADGRPLFWRGVVLLFGHARLVRAVEDFV